MTKFKKGDRVRCTERSSFVLQNATGTVYEDKLYCTCVQWDSESMLTDAGRTCQGWEKYGYVAEIKERLELISEGVDADSKPSRFPFKLTMEQGKRIINAACDPWKITLITDWGLALILHGSTMVTEFSYQQMRKACTPEQHILFDEIFGPDEIKCPYKAGEAVAVRDSVHSEWKLRYATGHMSKCGKVKTYCDQAKEGSETYWVLHKPLSKFIQ